MDADRLIPTSATSGKVGGNAFMNEVQVELTGLWNVAKIFLSNVGGTPNDITADMSPALTGALGHGMGGYLVPVANNTGPTTLKIGTIAEVPVVDKDGAALATDDLVAGRRYEWLFDGGVSSIVITGEVGSAAAVPTSFCDPQQFPASGTWTKSTRATATSMTLVFGWAAGGGGGSGANVGAGGGGAFFWQWFLTSTLGATETVTIPAGGAVNTAGGNATFGSWFTAYGGGGCNNVAGGGGGGGAMGAGVTSSGTGGGNGGDPVGGAGGVAASTSGAPSTNGGGGGGANSVNAGLSMDGGGGGGGNGRNGANSLRGGAGGGGTGGNGGTSVYGGNGGASGVAGSVRGGGGGRNAAGGRGEIWVITFF